jgi:hypothetical protein
VGDYIRINTTVTDKQSVNGDDTLEVTSDGSINVQYISTAIDVSGSNNAIVLNGNVSNTYVEGSISGNGITINSGDIILL